MSWLIHRWLLTCCILILVFKDSQSLFLRHTKSGKCIAAGYGFWNDGYAERYWAEMVDNCLNVSAQFRYYNELLKNIVPGGTFASNGGDKYKNRFHLYKGKPRIGNFENSTKNYLTQTPGGSLYRYNEKKCAKPSKSTKYVREINGECSDSAQQQFTFGSVTKFNAKMENVRCSSIQRMLIQKANYGDFDKSGTFDFNAPIDTKCSSLTTCKVKNLCGGLTNKSCELTVSADLISPYCTDNSKELYTEYTCVDTYSFTITQAPKVKLSESPNKGVLQINDAGVTWRKVDDKNWDKDRQEMLCQHLGFEKTNENNLSTRSLGSDRNIATGDLVCYDTQSSGTSCCVHLQPSKTSKTIKIPYVTCKICDHPLDLPNKQKFPDVVFSGSDGYTHHFARFNSAGWCSSKPNTAYLLIDLQKEYHITRIVIMGDKFQTKWSGSYLMKYSHNETLVDQSNKISITGNQNGFKASSTTPRNIFNVRYVKIQSTGTTKFCLRIEFCGNVQKPAFVRDIVITPSEFSAHVSWRFEENPAMSSYITHFDIYLGRSFLLKVPRNSQKRPGFQIDSLERHTEYKVGIVTVDGSLQSSGIADRSFKTTQAVNIARTTVNGNYVAAVGASLGAIIIVAVVVVVAIFFRRRMTLKRNSNNDISHNEEAYEIETFDNNGNDEHDSVKMDDHCSANTCSTFSNESEEKVPVPVENFAQYVNKMKAEDNRAFQSEHSDLPTSMDTSWEVAKKQCNKMKNRYANIVTYDYCRVVLSGDENEDYINASFIDGIKTNSYIASQGPNKKTIDDMWRMVWEQKSYSIVMVTSLLELGKPKCEKYWPDSGTEKYGDIEVTLAITEEFACHDTHTLQIKKDGEEREVRHYYFFSWPDHGVPKYPTQLLAFRRQFRTYHLEESGPVVVHCSAGVGRTGVFIAIDTILEKLEQGLINSIDVFGQVCAMRERRMNMIQTLEQYIFVHEAILETILSGINEVDTTRIQKEIENLSKIKASGMIGFEEKFKRLGEVSPIYSSEECTAALVEENCKKNRNRKIYPTESNRVPLQYVNGVENSDYINAVFVHCYLGRNYFIATQSPLANTINDFWRLVHLQKSSTIVLLNNVKNGTSFPKFWPDTRGIPTQYDSMTVQLESETEKDAIRTRKLILSLYPDLTDGQVVNIFHYIKWPDHRVPVKADGVITLTSLVEKSRQSHGQGPVIVACSDGAGRTGTYIAISNLLERMKIEQAVDVFQSIKIIRGSRPQFVETAEQYQFCYTAMMAYLDTFSDYSNFD